jgi:peptide-methionine (S)-S-oxide reductase
LTPPLSQFYPAHAEHQEYLMKNPSGYCNHRVRFKSWPYRPKASYADDTEDTLAVAAAEHRL